LFALIHLNWLFSVLILLVSVPDFLLQTKYKIGLWHMEPGKRQKKKDLAICRENAGSSSNIKEIKPI